MKINGVDIPIYKIPKLAINKISRPIRSRTGLMTSKRHIRKLIKKKSTSSKIKVAFLVQMPEIWDKTASVYERMSEDDRFETIMVIIPAYDFTKDAISEYGDELDFFKKAAKSNSYLLAYENGQWLDLHTLEADYIFYQRPYDHYLPRKYRTQTTSGYTKVCYIPYATPDLRKSVMYPDAFFRNIYLGFLDSEHLANEKNARFPYPGHECFLSVGYPPFEEIVKNYQRESTYSVVLWGPRWSYDPIVGGSHFFEYNDYFTNRNWTGKKLIVRVHPLLWENFEKEGRLTPETASAIRADWERNGIVIDSNKSITDTYAQTDILIADRSSIIPLFFLTGRPVIYCATETDYSALYLTILPGLYIANSQEELDKYLESLLQGIDPLKEKRREIIEKNFGNNKTATANIISAIIEDARGK